MSRAKTLIGAAATAFSVGDEIEANQHAASALTIARALHASRQEALALCYLGAYSKRADAQTLISDAVTIARRTEDRFLEGIALWYSVDVRLRRGAHAEAEHDAMDSLAIFRAIDHKPMLVATERTMARVLIRRGDTERAMLHLRASTRFLTLSPGGNIGMARCLCVWAAMAALRTEYDRAARLCGVISAWLAAAGMQLAAMMGDRAEFERALAAAQTHLAPAAFDAAFESGRRMPLDEAIADVLEEPHD
jgi:hypothetical protein